MAGYTIVQNSASPTPPDEETLKLDKYVVTNEIFNIPASEIFRLPRETRPSANERLGGGSRFNDDYPGRW
jgi:hypothetical protein